MDEFKFNDLDLYKKIQDRRLLSIIDSIVEKVKYPINSINSLFTNYTMHDMGHCYRVACVMAQLVEEKSLNDFEYTLLILCALLHDIGMYCSPEAIASIKDGMEDSEDLKFQGVFNVLGNENEAIKEFVRKIHHKRLTKVLNFKFDETTLESILKLGDHNFSDIVIDLCQSHGEGYDYLLNLKKDFCLCEYKANLQFLAVVLRIADLIDIDNRRVPSIMYAINKPQGFSDIEWKKHFSIMGYEHIRLYQEKIQICFYGECSDPIVYRNYLNYISYIEHEINLVEEKINSIGDKAYSLPLYKSVYNNVKPKGFSLVDLKLNLDYIKITSLLMGEHIYKNRMFGLRELLQNAIDSCNLMREKAFSLYKHDFSEYQPKIKIVISKKDNFVKIIDNGTGMSLKIIKKYFLNVGMSYYQSNDYIYENNKYKSIGKFGIGFLSSFLLSKAVCVTTRHYSDPTVYKVNLEKNSEYVVISEVASRYSQMHFTEIQLAYDDFFNVFVGGIEDVQSFIIKNIFTEIDILIEDADVANDQYSLSNKKINKESIITDSLNILKAFKGQKGLMQIRCENHSKIIDGNLIIRLNESYKSILIEDEKLYLYVSDSHIFNLVALSEIPNGEYYIFFNLKKVLNATNRRKGNCSKNRVEKFCEQDLKEKSVFPKLLIPIDANVKVKNGIFYIDEISLDNLMPNVTIGNETMLHKKSTFNYGLKTIYKNNDYILPLNGMVTSNYLINLCFGSIIKKELIPISMYFKQIYVTELEYELTYPFDMNILDSHINCNLDDGISLNIARDHFLQGENIYIKELDKTIILALKEFQEKTGTNNNILMDFFRERLSRLSTDI